MMVPLDPERLIFRYILYTNKVVFLWSVDGCSTSAIKSERKTQENHHSKLASNGEKVLIGTAWSMLHPVVDF